MLACLVFLIISIATGYVRADSIKDNDQGINQSLGSKKRHSEIDLFLKIAQNASHGYPGMYQDKTTTHSYQEMYGQFLLPMVHRRHRKGLTTKFLEIGLGCYYGKHYGAGILIWKQIFKPTDELWIADIDVDCIANGTISGALSGVHTLNGSQSNELDIDRWAKESGGNFDIIIDDGGHVGNHIYQTFYRLFDSALAPGGLYFIEDVHVNGFSDMLEFQGKKATLSTLFQGWTRQLMLSKTAAENLADEAIFRPLPSRVKWMFCQAEACLIAKCLLDDTVKCTP